MHKLLVAKSTTSSPKQTRDRALDKQVLKSLLVFSVFVFVVCNVRLVDQIFHLGSWDCPAEKRILLNIYQRNHVYH